MITSTKNPKIAKVARLHKRAMRDEDRRFLVESAQVALEALEAGVVESLFHVEGAQGIVVSRAREAGVPVEAVAEHVMGHLTSTVTPQDALAVARFVDRPLAEIPPGAHLVPVLCSVRDPGNAGTIVRSADAAGADAVVFAGTSVDVYNPKTVRASAGSIFHLPVVRDVSPEEAVAFLRGRGAQVLATAADGDESLYEADLSVPTAVLFGNEAWGLEPEVRTLADRVVRIPIHGKAESLNLAAAAVLVMFESARRRDGGGGAEAALGRIAELMGAGAHDLRSPLTALAGFVSTLVKNWDRIADDQKRSIVAGMAVDGQRVNALTRLLVDVIRIEAGVPLRGMGESAAVEDAATWVADLLSRSGDLPGVRATGSGRAAVDQERLRAMLLAVCEGAIWWGSEGSVEIEVAGDADAVRIEVSRSGRGPAPDEAAELFDHPESGGKVALFAAHRLAASLGGGLIVEPGPGTRFVLRLPAA